MEAASGLRPSSSPASIRRRNAILGAARELISEVGPDKVVIVDVAERADVSVATIYNLVGTRDQLFVALLEDAVLATQRRLGNASPRRGVGAVLDVLSTACDVVLEDADTIRHVLGAFGQLAPGDWLTIGLDKPLVDAVRAASTSAGLGHVVSAEAIATALQMSFRGVLISWVFGLLDDVQLRGHTELGALHVLLSNSTPKHRSAIEARLVELTLELDETTNLPGDRQ